MSAVVLLFAGAVAPVKPAAGTAAELPSGAEGAAAASGPATARRLRELEQELLRLRAEHERRTRELEAAIHELQREQQAAAAPVAPAAPVVTPGARAAAPAPAARSRSRSALNPGISVIGDFIARAGGEPGEDRDVDLELSELEIGFQAAVDPYISFDAFVGFHEHADEPFIGLPSELGHGDEEDEGHEEDEGGFEAELEEAFVRTLGLPGGLQLRAGKYRQRFGRHNLDHPHEDPWADQPTASVAMFGDEQLIDTGVELSWLVPTPFFWELSGSVTRGPGESPTFGRSEDDDFLTTLRNSWFWDVGAASTVGFGQSWSHGPAATLEDHEADVYGVDFTFKWIPSAYRSVTWETEAFFRDLPLAFEAADDGANGDHDAEDPLEVSTLSDWGAYTHLEVQLARRWFLGMRLDYFDYDDPFLELTGEDADVGDVGEAFHDVDDRWDASVLASWWASEFQTLRFQYRHTWDDLLESSYGTFFVNWIWVMGAHGAHDF